MMAATIIAEIEIELKLGVVSKEGSGQGFCDKCLNFTTNGKNLTKMCVMLFRDYHLRTCKNIFLNFLKYI